MEGTTIHYWDDRWKRKDTGWDMGHASEPLVAYTHQLPDKHIKVMIPGCGNAYEAEAMVKDGFTDITLLDISPTLVNNLRQRLTAAGIDQVQVICQDFFHHKDTYDLILEQTFFCALDPSLRHEYARHMYDLLKPGGKLTGLFFNKTFEGGPPFGGDEVEYRTLFNPYFEIEKMDPCYNSITPRSGAELFVVLKRKDH